MPRCVCFQHKLRILLITYEGSENITTTLVQTENWCRPSNHAFNSHICFKVGHCPKEASVIDLISELPSKIHLPCLHPPLSHAPWQIKVIGIRSSKPTDAQIFIPHRCSNFWRDNVTTSIRWTPHETPRDGGLFKGEGCFSKATSHHLKHNNPSESVVIVLLPSCWVSLQADLMVCQVVHLAYLQTVFRKTL